MLIYYFTFSPCMTYIPIKDIEIFIFNDDIISVFADGTINLVKMFSLFAPNTLNSLIKSLSQASIPFKIVRLVTITLIKSELNIIDLVVAPNQMMIRGPSATFGKLFNATINGSKILFKVLNEYSNKAKIKAIIKDKMNDIRTSIDVV